MQPNVKSGSGAASDDSGAGAQDCRAGPHRSPPGERSGIPAAMKTGEICGFELQTGSIW